MHALCLPLGASVSLLVMFFFFDSMQMLFAVCTAIIATVALAFLLLPMCQYIMRPCSDGKRMSFGFCGRFTAAELFSFSLAVSIVCIWVLTGHWLLMDGMSYSNLSFTMTQNVWSFYERPVFKRITFSAIFQYQTIVFFTQFPHIFNSGIIFIKWSLFCEMAIVNLITTSNFTANTLIDLYVFVLFFYSLLLTTAMGMGLCVAFIAFVRLPSLKVSTLLLTGLLLYDVFWVFFSSYIFSTNVMVKVATRPAENPVGLVARKLNLGAYVRDTPKLNLPGKLVFPSIHNSGHFSMLGLGMFWFFLLNLSVFHTPTVSAKRILSILEFYFA